MRDGNSIKPFANVEKWFTIEALLGVSIIVEFIEKQSGFEKLLASVALSSRMRSIGNVDVDVVRAEYRKTPRTNVDVLNQVVKQLKKMERDIRNTLLVGENMIGESRSIKVIENCIQKTEIEAGSISHIITSPPYGVESLSYLRTHLLSFRVLEPILGVDPYNFNDGVIGSEFLSEKNEDVQKFVVGKHSHTDSTFFEQQLQRAQSSTELKRVCMMMKFFEDMYFVVEKFAKWLKPQGRVAFVIGNKKIGKTMIPTDKIMIEIFQENGFVFDESIAHKLKTNNSNSQVPWQERIIGDEFILIFTKRG